MSNRPMTRSCSRDRQKLPDLNDPPTEESVGNALVALSAGDTIVPVNQLQGLQGAVSDGCISSPIDVEAIEDEVEVLYEFQQARKRRRHAALTLFLDMETRSARSGGVNVDTETYPVYSDESSTKRSKMMIPFTEPVVPQEPPTFTCPVCISELVEPCSTSCGHIFCQGCIKLSIQKTKKCPTCRKVLRTIKSYHRVYLPTAN